MGRMFFQILGVIAAFEHALMSERTLDGLSAAPRPGPHRWTEGQAHPRQARLAQQMYDEVGPRRPAHLQRRPDRRHIDNLPNLALSVP
jgi:DNA invertase Pin-like site-specific DNA recombinase